MVNNSEISVLKSIFFAQHELSLSCLKLRLFGGNCKNKVHVMQCVFSLFCLILFQHREVSTISDHLRITKHICLFFPFEFNFFPLCLDGKSADRIKKYISTDNYTLSNNVNTKMALNEPTKKSGAIEDILRNISTLSHNRCASNFMQFVFVVRDSQLIQHQLFLIHKQQSAIFFCQKVSIFALLITHRDGL